MSLKDIDLKCSYDSDEDDILNSFYIPALSQSIKYYRLAGFFSSTSFATAARGISKLIENGGIMKIVVSVKLTKDDVEAVQNGIKKPNEIIEQIMIKNFEQFEDELIKDHVRALAWLVANKKLEIKVAVMTDENGIFVEQENIEKVGGIFHQKVGLFQDNEGNIISFSGSINETAMAWERRNGEEFNVFRSWIEGELDHLKFNWAKFERYWYDQASRAKVFEIPEAVNKKLIEIAPSDIKELKNLDRSIVKKSLPTLRDYQQEAVKNWFDKNYCGIFEMATGVGKTYTALACAKELERKLESFGIVIVCPFKHLIADPWIKSIKDFAFEGVVIKAFESTESWINNLSNEILNLNSGISNKLIIVTTYDTFSSKDFVENMKKIEKPLLVIADEVHNVGSPERKKGLLEKYTYRLGLSATPSRWFDEEGTKIIFDFFNEIVYKFTIKQAINTINPDTGETYLTPYEYYPHCVEMTPEEFYEYEKISKKISTKYHQTKNDEEKKKYYEFLLFERSKIIKNAKNKIKEFEKIIDSIENINHCLIYCAPSKRGEIQIQMNLIKDLLDERGIENHRFTQEESNDEREELLKKFDVGKYKVLVAIKCLDEGVDVPSTKIAIILASTTNPREPIQRRGRVLRRFPGKEKAIIHDFIVIPTLTGNVPKETFEIERKILKNELERVEEFADASMNKLHTLNVLIPILKKYKLSLTSDCYERDRS